ncbi:hypothetical protein PFICI_06454 [Pestalotiopsis fici W106-1]|uniref:Uncharacterized protein n=1 Tax=Pestalotiopsis fici (strain W106-1 / CGMCC3.15140) TaxID=1229662 RepID=W3X7T2_PESFW|nr:uncharacterized protein PFICI_06454 [Pestalotiopsis fici W106-1]ETS81452.1 hypothetical protein PFICI_06454 [Pestalotiopsis fici W106-1]
MTTPNHIQPFRVPLAQEELGDPEAVTERQTRDREAVVELWAEETIANSLETLYDVVSCTDRVLDALCSFSGADEDEDDEMDDDDDDKEDSEEDEDEDDGWSLVSAPTDYAEDGCIYLGEQVRGVTFPVPVGAGCPRGRVREVLEDLNEACREMLGLPAGALPGLVGGESESVSSCFTADSYE